MKRQGLIVIFYFAFFLLFFPGNLCAGEIDEIITRIQTKYAEINDLKGTFSQTSIIKDLERKETYNGTFYIKKPSSIKWIYTKPRDEEVTIKGNTIWIYKSSEKQAMKSTFSQDAYGQVPIALLNSLGRLKEDFYITIKEKDTLELKPKHGMGYIKHILLKVNKLDFPIRSFSIFDVYGNKIDITVNNVETNPGLEESFFVFSAPEGVEVFDLNQ
jgi:outer membrane lipoprotein carrier protein